MAKGKNNGKTSNKVERTNTGTNRVRKNPQTHADLIRMGKGHAQRMKHVECGPWLGASKVLVPFDKEQAEKNIAAGLC